MSGSDAPNSMVQGYRLSPQQERVWLLERGAQSIRLFARCRVMLEGSLDAAVLKMALEDILQRHEILRTTLQCIPGMTLPVQVIAEQSALSHQEYDLTGRMPSDQECQIETLLQGLQEERADSMSSSSMHTILIKLSDVKHLLMIDLPGYCVDGVTFKNLIRELEATHEAYAQGVSAVLDDPLQYADFAEWQHSLLSDEAGQVGRTHWRKQAEGIVGPLGNRLPFERALSDGVNLTLKRIPIAISKKCLAQVNSLVEQKASASSTFFLACWRILLQRLIGREDIVVGVACDGRTHDEMRNAFGPFARYLPVLTTLDQNLPFSTALERLQQAVAEAHEWQEYFAWEDIQNAPIRGDGSYFPFCFEFEEEQSSCSNATLSFRIESKETYLDRFKIRLVCHRKDGFIDAILQYDESCYPDEVMACLAKQLETLVSQAACQPEAAIGDIETLGELECHQVLHTFNVCPPQERCDQCLHHLFEAQSAHAPDNIALVYEEQSVTYRELDRRANQLAHYLKSQGVGPETAVGICVERSPELIVGLLGILKAGGAYVPIDPSYPKDRRDYLLHDSRAPILLIQNRFREEFLGTPVSIVSIDSETQPFEEYSELKPSTHETPAGVAYIIYTSGSTGRPKGVLVTHRNAVHSTKARRAYYKKPVTSFLLLSSFAFDSSVAGIFWTLSQGGRLCLVREGVQKAPSELGALIEQAQVTHLLCLPSLYSVLLEQVPVAQLNSLHTIIVAGESCPKDLVARHQANLPLALLFNEYGPTEGTVWSTVHRTSVSDEGATVSIGRPIAGVRIYILDAHMRPVSIGMLGELFIAGEGLARAYHDRPDLTAMKFIPDPFSPVEGGRLYRTGDLARYRPDGTIEFAGRGDQQVKIRGYRIEPGEIEARLLEHPAVQDAIVLAREAVTGDMLMVAYVVQRENAQDTTALREFLKERLPEYMIPSATIVLTGFPLTPNGKVDRKALPMPDVTGQLAHQYVAPRSPTEELLCGIWANVLQVAQVGVHDNFFDLGGHSLLATQVMVRLRDVFRVDLPMRVLFETATVAKLAEAVESARLLDGSMDAPSISRVERDGPVPLSFAQQRLWVLTQLEPHGASYNLPIALRLSGRLDVAALERSVNELVRRHEVLQTIVSLSDGQPVQTVTPASTMSVPLVALDHLSGSEREAAVLRLATDEAQRPFELAYGPMLRVTLLKLDAEEHVLLLTMHHIVSDAWSSHILVREMTELYIAQVQGRPASLPELPAQYADFAIWQRQWLSGARLDRQVDYWKERLAGALEPLNLPMDRARSPVQTSRGASLTLLLSSELSAAMTELSRREGVTMFMTLLAGFYTLLFRYTGRTDLIVGSPIANRTRSEIEGLIGFFVNTLALRADLSGRQTVRELLALVRQVCLGAYTHQDVPFEKLVEVLQPVRDVSYSPIFQVMFELQNAPASELDIPGLRIDTVDVESLTAKFDLTLTLCETDSGLTASMEYNTDLFSADRVMRMLRHYELILQNMAARPDAAIEELRLLTGEEEQRLLTDWNVGPSLPVPDRSFSRLFEAQTSATPDSVAAVWLDRRVTYHELNRRANRVAHALLLKGVGPETAVALLGDRDLDFLTMLLGILKAGGIYLPLDAGHPDHRLAHMLGESRAPVLLTTEAYRQRVKPLTEGLAENSKQILLTMEEIQSSVEQDSNPSTPWHAAQTVYVIYTSGSTGLPKGAMVEHRGMLNHLWGKVTTLRLTATDVIAQTASQCFDISVWQFLAPLLCGGRVCIVPDDIAHDPARLLRHVEAAGVTVFETVPALLQGMLDMAADADDREPELKRLRMVLPTGEALSGQLCRRWLGRYPSIPLVNAYGPAECADDVALHQIIESPDGEAAFMPIGMPVPNLDLYVLSPSLKPLPVGVAGELCVAGVGVGRGYLLNPAKTAEVFVPHPFAKEPGARLYRTGDMAHYLPNGVIQFIGRMDHQVKVRGFRMELGEIESQLLAHPDVHEAAVVTREDARGDKRLVAYAAGGASSEALREFLRGRLPDYMVPSVLVVLESLPRNGNGKLDRRSLPEPAGRDPQQTFVAPRTDMETRLAREWAEVLGLPQVGIHDNFFDLGGHSLTAVQLVSRIQRMIGNPVALLDLFQAPTVAGLAHRISGQAEAASSPFVVLQVGRGGAPLFCFDPTGTHVSAYQSLAYALGEDRPVYGLTLSWIFSEPWNALSMDRIAEHYATIIRERQPDGPYHLLGWSNGGAVALAVGRLLEQQGRSLAFLGILDTQPQTASESRASVGEELNHYIQGDRREAFLALPETERKALKDGLAQLNEEERVEHAIGWAQARNLLSREESDASVAALKVAYALDRETVRILNAVTQNPLRASIHAWWTSATLDKCGGAPIDWSRCTRGPVETGTVLGEHTDAVRSIQVHQQIGEILSRFERVPQRR
ncbi:MAG: amino acid adenylation domain-containing protein [Nitrospira sp.]|nr:amino acid adenylation domain-containing protein [Nitrospira sp.]